MVGAVGGRYCDNGPMNITTEFRPDGQQVDVARLADVCGHYGVVELSVFGSFARGEAGPNSDIDLLFVLGPDARLGFAIFQLEKELAEIFDRRVDLLSRDSIHPLIRDEVLSEARLLYEA